MYVYIYMYIYMYVNVYIRTAANTPVHRWSRTVRSKKRAAKGPKVASMAAESVERILSQVVFPRTEDSFQIQKNVYMSIYNMSYMHASTHLNTCTQTSKRVLPMRRQ